MPTPCSYSCASFASAEDTVSTEKNPATLRTRRPVNMAFFSSKCSFVAGGTQCSWHSALSQRVTDRSRVGSFMYTRTRRVSPPGPRVRPRSSERNLVVAVDQLGVFVLGRLRAAQEVDLLGDDLAAIAIGDQATSKDAPPTTWRHFRALDRNGQPAQGPDRGSCPDAELSGETVGIMPMGRPQRSLEPCLRRFHRRGRRQRFGRRLCGARTWDG